MRMAETRPPQALNEAGISNLIATFYDRVRADESLAPVFARAIPEGHWAGHLGHMSAFWSSVMQSSGRYHGKPVQMHAKHLDALIPAMFTRWLELWAQTAHALFPPEQATLTCLFTMRFSMRRRPATRHPSARIARSRWAASRSVSSSMTTTRAAMEQPPQTQNIHKKESTC